MFFRSQPRTPPWAGGVAITGASSGIGAALAEACARRGAGALYLCGRDRARLAEVAAACRAAGAARVQADAVDVTDAAAVAAWLAACDAEVPLTLVFANAGRGTGRESAANVRATFETNLMGVVNTVLPAIDLFRARRAPGQIVLTASISGYPPLMGCPSYSGTKAAVKNWGLALRGFLKQEGIRVNVLCPGFVRSRITARNTCPMPFFMEAPRAARIILDHVARNTGLIAFPWPMRLAVWVLALLPWRLAEALGAALPAKDADNSQRITL